MKLVLQLIVAILVIGLFLYSKLLPYKDRLDAPYKKTFGFFETIFKPVLELLKSFIKPTKVGQNLGVDMTQIVLLIIFLILLIL